MAVTEITSSDEENGAALIQVEVAYATPERQLILALEVPVGTTALQAVRQSSIEHEFPQIDINKDSMGIFSKLLDGKGRPKPDEYVLSAGDRVEIYRPLIIDPKAARLDRAKTAQPSKKNQKQKK